jgi:BarA-like signal transduction histidine kinase
MTEQMNEEQMQRSLMLGAKACLAKPLDHQQLFKAMGLCLEIPEKGALPQMESYQ